MKRFFDLLAAGVGLVPALPVIAVLVLMIRAESDGPGIFSQQRVGRNGHPFRLYKLRTMKAGTGDVPTHHAASAQITALGRTLRRLKLDELPQLWNVVRGEMSLVGPRPCLPSQVELIEARQRRGVLALRPGITGLAQIQGVDMADPEKLATIDQTYLQNRSFAGDISILLRTVMGGEGRGDRVSGS